MTADDFDDTRFWSHVDKGVGCWEWTGSRMKGEYGQFSTRSTRQARGKTTSAHRVAWILTQGPIPDGLWVLHRCDNPPCCNPDHLFLGTHADNMADCSRKGRKRTGVRSSTTVSHGSIREMRPSYWEVRILRRGVVVSRCTPGTKEDAERLRILLRQELLDALDTPVAPAFAP